MGPCSLQYIPLFTNSAKAAFPGALALVEIVFGSMYGISMETEIKCYTSLIKIH